MERIAVDVTPAINGSTGIARYVTQLTRALAALPDAPALARVAFGRAALAPEAGVRHVGVPLRVLATTWRVARQPRVERFIGPVTSVHASGAVLPAANAPVVAVVQDLAPIDHPELHPARDVEQLRRFVGGLDRVAAVIASSQATADRLAREGIAAEHITVVPLGRAPLPPPGPPLRTAPYVLAVGAPVRRKRFDLLLRAVASLARPDLAVVIVGPAGPEDAPLDELAESLRLGERYVRARDVDDTALATWYAHAAAVVAPSVEEGFGFPLVEALGLGTPVVATDLSVFHEVTGDHATFVPVDDEAAIADAIARLLDGGIDTSAQVERGAAHVAQYRWDVCASATLAVHRRVSRGA